MSDTPAFAIVCTTAIFCPDTDAVMGSGTFVYERHLTKRAADARCAALSSDETYMGDYSFHVELRPFREGEDKMPRPRYSLLELHYDALASAENCPPWAQ